MPLTKFGGDPTLSFERPPVTEVELQLEQVSSVAGLLREARDEPEKQQEIVNSLFTDERREQLVRQASKDSSGRKVRYYRYMELADFVSLLELGRQTAQEMNPDLDATVDPDLLKDFLYDYSNELGFSRAEYEVVEVQGLEEQLKFLFSDEALTDQVKEIVARPTYRKVLPFLEENVPEEIARREHVKGPHKYLFPYLSLSVGGIIRFPIEDLKFPLVYIEAVIPDEQMKKSPAAQVAEKEMLTKGFTVDQISRVFITDQQLIDGVLSNPEIPVGEFWREHNFKGMQKWRAKPTENYIPVSFLK